jgi:enoyl-CoA hydratase/carnithine racemase
LSTAHVQFDIDGPIATLTFNRPEARNALTWEMYRALGEACDRVDQDPAIRVWILRGAGGKAFVAGTDIAQFESFRTPNDGIDYEHRLDAALDRLEHVHKPTIAQVEGVAAGGGCAIALVCDLRVATSESTFGIPIARTLGNCLSAATCARLMDTIGPAHAREMLMTGRFTSAQDAQAQGWVNRVAAAADIARVTRELAAELASNAPLTLRATKEMFRRITARRRLAPGEDRDLIEMCYTSSDFREGVASFLAKRPARWTGT